MRNSSDDNYSLPSDIEMNWSFDLLCILEICKLICKQKCAHEKFYTQTYQPSTLINFVSARRHIQRLPADV